MRQISKSEFKPHALRYFREVQASGQEIVITDRGIPVLKIVPFRPESHKILEELRGSVLRYDAPTEPVGMEDWEALE